MHPRLIRQARFFVSKGYILFKACNKQSQPTLQFDDIFHSADAVASRPPRKSAKFRSSWGGRTHHRSAHPGPYTQHPQQPPIQRATTAAGFCGRGGRRHRDRLSRGAAVTRTSQRQGGGCTDDHRQGTASRLGSRPGGAAAGGATGRIRRAPCERYGLACGDRRGRRREYDRRCR